MNLCNGFIQHIQRTAVKVNKKSLFKENKNRYFLLRHPVQQQDTNKKLPHSEHKCETWKFPSIYAVYNILSWVIDISIVMSHSHTPGGKLMAYFCYWGIPNTYILSILTNQKNFSRLSYDSWKYAVNCIYAWEFSGFTCVFAVS